MGEEHYIFVVMDSTGGPTRRYPVKRATLLRLAWGAAAFLVLLVFFGIHAYSSHRLAQESLAIARENRALHGELEVIGARLHALEGYSRRTTRVALQVFDKAGLEREASVLAAGPLKVAPAGSGPVDGLLPEGAPAGSFLGEEPADWVLRLAGLDSSLGHLVEYFRDADRLLLNTPAINPSPSGWFTSKFGMRIHPVHGKRMMHKGQDIAGAIGKEVFAPADGVVIWATSRGGYGRTIVLDHGYGLQTHFAHLDAYRVRLGDRVRRGDLIGLMGNSGVSTGPHLHYEVRRHGRPLNPMDFILD